MTYHHSKKRIFIEERIHYDECMGIFETVSVLRLSIFFGIFFLMALWEVGLPRRSLTQKKGVRWLNNLSISALNTVLLQWVFHCAAFCTALGLEASGEGVLINSGLPVFAQVLLTILVFDFLIYLQHIVFHKVPLLWRFHRMHHSDTDLDVSSGARFHPVEILISMGFKILCILVIGPPAIGVLIFEILLNASSMFNHSNIDIPQPIEKRLRTCIVTPDMHRIHHSSRQQETDSNYGFNLSIWDRIFNTATKTPQHGHQGMTVGLSRFRDPKESLLLRLLTQPFR